MKKRNVVTRIILVGAVFFISASAAPHVQPDFSQQSAEDLYQAALLKKEAEGDLSGAIKMFQDIIKKFADNRAIAAKSQLQIGLCFEKQGLGEAEKAFQKVVEDYPEQAEAVRLAREKLAVGAAKGDVEVAAADVALTRRAEDQPPAVGSDQRVELGSGAVDRRPEVFRLGPAVAREFSHLLRSQRLCSSEIDGTTDFIPIHVYSRYSFSTC